MNKLFNEEDNNTKQLSPLELDKLIQEILIKNGFNIENPKYEYVYYPDSNELQAFNGDYDEIFDMGLYDINYETFATFTLSGEKDYVYKIVHTYGDRILHIEDDSISFGSLSKSTYVDSMELDYTESNIKLLNNLVD